MMLTRGGTVLGGRRASALDVRVGRMPGPVWTLAVFTLIASANLLAALALSSAPDAPRSLFVAGAILGVAIAGTLWVLGERTPWWLLHVLTATTVLIGAVLVARAATAVGAISASFGFMTISLYTSYWFSRVQALRYLFAMALVDAAALWRAGWPGMVAPWLLIVGTMGVLVFVLSTLRSALESAATLDELTGLLNRRGLEALITADRDDNRNRDRCLLIIDFDDFKMLNDSRGHLAGDRALRSFGEACRRTLRPGDLALRAGGDEFVLILDQLPASGIDPIIDRLHRLSPVSWSHGVADWPPRADFDEAMARADADLYRRKDALRVGRDDRSDADRPGEHAGQH